MTKKKEAKKSGLLYERKNFFKEAPQSEHEEAFKYAKGFKTFLDECKTVRETVAWTEKVLKKHKFTTLDAKAAKDKVYTIFRGKTMAMAILGSEPLSNGCNIVGLI